jgi:prevent-host-death family protein
VIIRRKSRHRVPHDVAERSSRERERMCLESRFALALANGSVGQLAREAFGSTAGDSWTNLLAKEGYMTSEAVTQFNIHDAKTNLSRIIERVEHGEEIVISRAGTPVAKVVPLVRTVNRLGRGSLRGVLVIADDWDSDAVNDTIAADFGLRP